MIQVRQGVESDIPIITPMSERFCKEIGIPYNAATVRKRLEFAVITVDAILLVATEMGDVIVGAAAAFITSHMSDENVRTGYEFLWHTDPAISFVTRSRAMLKLLDGLETWAQDKGVELHVSASMSPAKKELQRRGYAEREVHYAKEMRYGN